MIRTVSVVDAIKFEVFEDGPYEDDIVLSYRAKFARTIINDRPILEYVEECEQRIARDGGLDEELIGDYMEQFANTLYRYLTNKDCRLFDNTTIGLMVCGGCLDEGCWPLFVKMDEKQDFITWFDFYNPYVCGDGCCGPLVDGKPYDIGPFHFARNEFEKAVEDLKEQLWKDGK